MLEFFGTLVKRELKTMFFLSIEIIRRLRDIDKEGLQLAIFIKDINWSFDERIN